ncbi:MAG: 4-hydroxythreonine-4-phosphate dehydrogenase PdxA [Pseudomonadota bacterium]
MSGDVPPLVISMGDPSGIGPEIVAKCFAGGHAPDCFVVGSPDVMRRAASLAGLNSVVREANDLTGVSAAQSVIPVLRTVQADHPFPLGTVSASSGRAAFDAIVRGIELVKTGSAAGIITAPIHKEALSAAGISYPGHTEMLADFGGADRVAMMLANDEIRTVLVTIHVSLREAIEHADFDAQLDAIELAHEACIDLDIESPKVAVAGLNPHAGEGGRFGREEIEVIAPAIEAARARGIDASGPWPGDTVFMAARRGKFDVVVAQYHDQGLIPVKYLGVEKGVNVTLGLPFVRTSPDHGTAFDIAGKGIADPSSMATAIAYARRLVATRRRARKSD